MSPERRMYRTAPLVHGRWISSDLHSFLASEKIYAISFGRSSLIHIMLLCCFFNSSLDRKTKSRALRISKRRITNPPFVCPERCFRRCAVEMNWETGLHAAGYYTALHQSLLIVPDTRSFSFTFQVVDGSEAASE